MLDCLSKASKVSVINAQDKSLKYCHGIKTKVNLKVIMIDCFSIATKVSSISDRD